MTKMDVDALTSEDLPRLPELVAEINALLVPLCALLLKENGEYTSLNNKGMCFTMMINEGLRLCIVHWGQRWIEISVKDATLKLYRVYATENEIRLMVAALKKYLTEKPMFRPGT